MVRTLKTAVIVMGVMLVVGFASLVAVIANRLSHPPAPTPAPASTPTAASAPTVQPFAAAPIDLPAGARVEAIGTGFDRAVVDIVLPDGSRQLVVIELATGRRLGTIPLRTAP